MTPFGIRTLPEPDLEVPDSYGRLREIVFNLWWTWSHQTRGLFRRMAPATWRHYRNPIDVLIDLSAESWRTLQHDDDFAREYHGAVEQFDAYMSPEQPTWFERRHGEQGRGPFAYFSMEYGWHECLQIYSGGLGVLSGDHCKAASDLGLPFIGLGLMYKHGYFRQTIDAEGMQQHFYPDYDLQRLPLLPVADRSGRELFVPVDLPGRTVTVRVFRALVGRVPVLLLDSDLPINHPADRPITSILYVRDREMRLCQEILLGLGGVRVLEALGIRPTAWHLNEGHSALLSLQRVADRMQREQLSAEVALELNSTRTLFTTHTPVPAGNEVFEAPLVRSFFTEWSGRTGFDIDRLLQLGRHQDDTNGESFNLTAMALRTSGRANGVSRLHGQVANDLWKPLLDAEERPPIGSVTNGIHVASWIGPQMDQLLRKHLGPMIDDPGLDPGFADAVAMIPAHELWMAHLMQKQRLVGLVRERTMEQYARHGRSPSALRRVEELLDPEALTIAFARRFATYKRADLLLRDEKRLAALLTDTERPVQLLFSGKAHPADRPGQELIRKISQVAGNSGLQRRVVFLENYDMRIARHLVQGADLWLNTPRRPHEASGTSGMKAAVNGVLNCSILDGWWCEGHDPSHGWTIGEADDQPDEEGQDTFDLDALYDVLTREVVPTYYERNDQGLPVAWIQRMARSIGLLSTRFCAARMVREYTERYYLPASRGELVGVGEGAGGGGRNRTDE